MDYQLGDTIEIRINTNGAILGQYFNVERDIDVVVSLFADAAQEAAYERGRGEKPCRIYVRHYDSFQAWRGGILSRSAHGWRRSGDLVAARVITCEIGRASCRERV